MIKRIRRNAVEAVSTDRIEELMKSISLAQVTVEQQNAVLKKGMAELFVLMKAAKLQQHSVDAITAELYRPAGRASTHIDVAAFRKMVKDDAEFYGAVSVSVTKAKELLPKKQLEAIATVTPATPGEETLRVTRG